MTVNGSGDLADLVARSVLAQGGRKPTNTPPVLQASWLGESHTGRDVFVVEGDHFAEVQMMLKQAYGVPDPGIHSTTPETDGRSLIYTPEQIGVALILTGDSSYTVVSIIGKKES